MASAGPVSSNVVTPLMEKCMLGSVLCPLCTGHSCMVRQDRCPPGCAKARRQAAAGIGSSAWLPPWAPEWLWAGEGLLGWGVLEHPVQPCCEELGRSPRTGRVRGQGTSGEAA